MARITLRQLLDHAAEHGYGVPAFNINNMEQGLAIMEAAKACNAPVIIQASRGARSYAGDIMLSKMIDALTEMYPDIPICMHQDHGNNEATCMSAIRHGFTSVMMDGSLEADMKTPASYDYNVTITERVARMAHWVGASVEGELGVLGSLETGEAEAEDGSRRRGQALARPAADRSGPGARFRAPHQGRRAGDCLRHVARRLQVLAQARWRHPGDERDRGDPRKMPNTHLVMHGSSSVPQELQDIINEFGGEMPQTFGVPVEEIVRGIKHGVRKVNIDTDCRMAMTGQFRKIATSKASEFDPRKFLKPAMDAMRDLCRDRFEAFGTAGQASKIRVIAMDDMAARYASGALDPQTTTAKAA
jgi:fructose-bisphosphate aldolase class II